MSGPSSSLPRFNSTAGRMRLDEDAVDPEFEEIDCFKKLFCGPYVIASYFNLWKWGRWAITVSTYPIIDFIDFSSINVDLFLPVSIAFSI